jgi:preprotein translocase subunit YajC
LSVSLAAQAVDPGGAVAPVAPADGGAAPAGAASQPSIWPSILLMGGIFAFMWFVLIRPQRKEEKRRKEMIDAMKRGDKVVTIGGVHGVVETVGEATIDVRIGDGSGLVVTYNKGAVQQNLSAESATKK